MAPGPVPSPTTYATASSAPPPPPPADDIPMPGPRPVASGSASVQPLPPPVPTADAESLKKFARSAHDGEPAAQDAKAKEKFLKDIVQLAKTNPVQIEGVIEEITALFVDKPDVAILWSALDYIAAVPQSVHDGGGVELNVALLTPLRQVVSAKFWEKYNALPKEGGAEKRVAIATQLVKYIGPSVTQFHRDILSTLSQNEPRVVRDAIRFEISQISHEDIDDNKRDWVVVRDCESNLISSYEADCKKDSKLCSPHVRDLSRDFRRYMTYSTLSFNAGTRTYSSFATGDNAISSNTYGGGLTFDWMDIERNGTRTMVGATLNVGTPKSVEVGFRLGAAAFLNPGLLLKMPVEVGFLWMRDTDKDRRDVPLTQTGAGYQPDGTPAVFVQPKEVERVWLGGYGVFAPELHLNLFGPINFFIGARGGVFVAGVRDSECKATYDASKGGQVTVTPTPNRDGYQFSQTGTSMVGSRCRSGSPVAGFVYGANAGFSGTF